MYSGSSSSSIRIVRVLYEISVYECMSKQLLLLPVFL